MRRTKTEAYLLDTRYSGEEFVVVADVLGASEDNLFVGLDTEANELVVEVHDERLERVTLPWEAVEVTGVTLNNGVLEARIHPSSP